jgi:hypothetical protein
VDVVLFQDEIVDVFEVAILQPKWGDVNVVRKCLMYLMLIYFYGLASIWQSYTITVFERSYSEE